MKIARTIAVVSVVLGTLVTCGSSAERKTGADRFCQMRDQQRPKFELMGMLHKIAEIEKDPKYALTPDQAKKLLAVLKPLRAKPTLTQEEARDAAARVKKALTDKQLKGMEAIKGGPPFGHGRMGKGGPPCGPGGPPPGGPRGEEGRPPRFGPNAMKDFNPLYVGAKPQERRPGGRAAYWDDFFAGLEKKAQKRK